MRFETPLIEATLLRRYQRFLLDAELEDGRIITAHTPNTGSMAGCSEPGSRIWLSCSANPKRKYAHTLELVQTASGICIGVHTLRSNRLAEEAILSGLTPLSAFEQIRREVKYGKENSRVDLVLSNSSGPRCYIEVKNTTLQQHGVGYFPDAPTARGIRHLSELEHCVAQGDEAVIFFTVQRMDVDAVRAATHIDPDYSAALTRAINAGVQALACRFDVSTKGIFPDLMLPVLTD